MAPSTNADLILEDVAANLARRFGKPHREQRARIVTFGSNVTCSLNYSKLLGGHKYFFGLPASVLDPHARFGPAKLGEYVLLICGSAGSVLVLPRPLVVEMLAGVASRRVDVFYENDMYLMQTTKHPKLDVTKYLNAFPVAKVVRDESASDKEETTRSDRVHLRVQSALITLGRAEGCAVWVPVNDRNLSYRGEPFSARTVARLPNFGFEETTRRIVHNIDVLWLTKNVILKAFEIESTTSIYSGLLRLNDLVLAQPNNQIELYLASAKARRHRVHSQLLRLTFQPLMRRCRYIAFEDIEERLGHLEKLELGEGTRVTGLLRGEKFEAPEHLVNPSDF